MSQKSRRNGKGPRTRTRASQYESKNTPIFSFGRKITKRAKAEINLNVYGDKQNETSYWRKTPTTGLRKINTYSTTYEKQQEDLRKLQNRKISLSNQKKWYQYFSKSNAEQQKAKINKKEAELRQTESLIREVATKHPVQAATNIASQLTALKKLKGEKETAYTNSKEQEFEAARKNQQSIAKRQTNINKLKELQNELINLNKQNQPNLMQTMRKENLYEEIKAKQAAIEKNTSYSLASKARTFENVQANSKKGLFASLRNTWSMHKDKTKGREITPQEATALIRELRNPKRKTPLNNVDIRKLRYLESLGTALPSIKNLENRTKLNTLLSNTSNSKLTPIQKEKIIKLRERIATGNINQKDLSKAVSELGTLTNSTLAKVGYNSAKRTVLKALSSELDEARVTAPIEAITKAQQQAEAETKAAAVKLQQEKKARAQELRRANLKLFEKNGQQWLQLVAEEKARQAKAQQAQLVSGFRKNALVQPVYVNLQAQQAQRSPSPALLQEQTYINLQRSAAPPQRSPAPPQRSAAPETLSALPPAISRNSNPGQALQGQAPPLPLGPKPKLQ